MAQARKPGTPMSQHDKEKLLARVHLLNPSGPEDLLQRLKVVSCSRLIKYSESERLSFYYIQSTQSSLPHNMHCLVTHQLLALHCRRAKYCFRLKTLLSSRLNVTQLGQCVVHTIVYGWTWKNHILTKIVWMFLLEIASSCRTILKLPPDWVKSSRASSSSNLLHYIDCLNSIHDAGLGQHHCWAIHSTHSCWQHRLDCKSWFCQQHSRETGATG